jgi:NADPH2:quinone reductase
MRAIVLHEFGPPENLRYEEIDDPEPGAGQVRIAVASAGVHLVDTIIRRGVDHGPYPQPQLPAVPGREVAGVVDAVGPDVGDEWLGRRVVAHLGAASAGYAELAVREVDALHTLPDGLADDAAVAMIGTGRTTMAILDVAQITPEDVVLVTAAAGGIGSLLVQAARAAGARVIGAARGTGKVQHVRELGADRAVDYAAPGWEDEVGEVTVLLDGVGGELGRSAFERLAPGGRAIVFGGASGGPIQFDVWDLYRRGLTVSAAIGARPRTMRALEERALAAAADGSLVPAVERFPLAEAAAAHAAIEARATIGKVVLVPERT